MSDHAEGKASLSRASVRGVGKKAKAQRELRKLPKTKCCASKKRCDRCPIRMLKEGTLPEGYTVRKRVLVRADGRKVSKKKLQKAA